MDKLARNKVKGSTLVEVVVSMVMIMIIIGGFLASTMSIQKSFNNNYLTKTYLIFLEHFSDCTLTLEESNSEIVYDFCWLNKSLTPVNGKEGIFEYKIEVFNNNNQMVHCRSKYYTITELTNIKQ